MALTTGVDVSPRDRAELERWLRSPSMPAGLVMRAKIVTGAIRAFIDGWNDRCQPFVWTKTANQLLPHATGGQRTSITRR